MKRFLMALVMATVCCSGESWAQTFSLFHINSSDRAYLDKVAKDYEIVGREGSTYQVYVPVEKAAEFKTQHADAKLIAADVDAEWKEAWLKTEDFATGYHDFKGVQDFMANAVKTYPNLVTVQTYGSSRQGNTLSYLHINNGKPSDTPKPKLFFDAATHGDELISVEVLLNLVNELLVGYGTDDRLTAMLDKSDIYVSFVVNPDGFIKHSRYDNFVDPNRSYPWPGDPSHKPTACIQPLMDLFAKEQFNGSMTFHANGKLLMYPWAYTVAPLDKLEDRTTFAELADELSVENHYKHGPIATTIYVAEGSSADYYYWKFATEAMAVELATSKVPSAAHIPDVTTEAREMVWKFIEHFSK